MKKYLILLFVAAAAVFQSCDNNDDLWDAIDDLKSRVQALETQVEALNSNIEALSVLYSGATVSEVKNEDGKCTITLSNGTVLTLVSDIDALVPVISIDENGCWQYTIGDGEPVSLGVKAVAEDGKTPTFQVSDDGYWQVDLGDGQGWQYVYYADGTSKVSAITDDPQTDKFFKSVDVVGDSLHIVMQNGEELDIPIVQGFLCQIVDGEGNVITDVQSFDMGVTKEFKVNMRGVDNTILTAPEGWTAELSEPVAGADDLKTATLSVTSPAATRATASTAKDVSILATSGKYACIAKIQVESTGVDPNAPRITVANSTEVEATSSTLTFDVVLTNATTWKYICQPSSEQAPTADAIMESGTDGSGTSVTVSDLSGDTAYTIYVVAYDGGAVSDVASAQNRTLVAPVDYYEAGYEIDGVIYNKETADVNLITESTDISSAGVYFIDFSDKTKKVTVSGKDGSGHSELVIIGRYSDSKPTVELSTYLSMKGPGTGFVFKNVKLDGSGLGNYMFNLNGTNDISHFVIEDCEIETSADKALGYFSAAGSIGKFILKSNKFHMNVSGASKTGVHVLNIAASVQMDKTSEFTVQNNVIYADYVTTGGLINNAATASSSTATVDVSNNTFVNYLGVNAYVVMNNAATIGIDKNLIWSEAFSSSAYFLRLNLSGNSVTFNLGDNCIYRNGATGSWVYISSAGYMPTNYEASPTVTMASSDPFADGTFDLENGIFIPGSSYSGYGSDLQ